MSQSINFFVMCVSHVVNLSSLSVLMRRAGRSSRSAVAVCCSKWKVPREEEATVHSIAPFRMGLSDSSCTNRHLARRANSPARTGDVPKLQVVSSLCCALPPPPPSATLLLLLLLLLLDAACAAAGY